MLEGLILGAIQGIAEWLPVSSEGILVLAQISIFGETSLVSAIEYSLFLHLGTFLAALVYFFPKVKALTTSLFDYQNISQRKEINFYIIATVISGGLGFLLLKALSSVESELVIAGRIIMLGIGILLIITAIIQFYKKVRGEKLASASTLKDGIILGLTQALAVLPGVSRSGSTTGVLLLRKFTEKEALTMSFILSLPIVLFGNIFLNLGQLEINPANILALFSSFAFGLATIHGLLALARKINFAWFVLAFGLLTILASFI